MADNQEKNGDVGVEEDQVDPWNVQSKSNTGIDYDKLISKLEIRKKIEDYLEETVKIVKLFFFNF